MSLLSAARRLAKILAATNHKIVFAESCTAGLVAQSLSRIPGISPWHCGSMVTYRNEQPRTVVPHSEQEFAPES